MKPSTIVKVFAAVVVVLLALCFIYPRDGIKIAGHYYYYPSMRSLVDDEQHDLELSVKTMPAEIVELSDSVAYYRTLVSDGALRFWLPDSSYLDAFWQRAEEAQGKNTVLRVLHYGDSQIEMDHITSRLRSYLQATFGGGGPGMVPVSPVVPSPTVLHGSEGDLEYLASFGDSNTIRSYGNYGVMMQSFRLNGSAITTLRASRTSGVDERAMTFADVRLVYNNRGALRATLTRKGGKQPMERDGAAGVGSMVWHLDAPTSSLRLSLSGSADLYCITVDNGAGVAVDNIPMRGCSGQQFTQSRRDLLTAAYQQLDVGLIIMQFGGNSVPYLDSSEEIARYCSALGKQIDHLHRCCPDARILFVGPSDMSTRVRGQLQTYPIMSELIDSLSTMALRHDAAFWSIYHAMGGANSMPQWADQGLAGKDYIHFSQRGADLMGDRMAEAFDNSYQLFCLQRRLNRYYQENKQR